MTQPIVSAEWLKNNLANPDVILLDASQKTNKSGNTASFNDLQIPGARMFDLNGAFRLPSSSLPNMMPTQEQFEQACRTLGINTSSNIVVYDNLGTYFSPRVWWMFKTMGHEQVAVLDGGLPNWISKGFKTEPKQLKQYPTGDFCATFNDSAVKSFEFIKDNLTKQDHIVIDARSSARFNGLAPEPREGLRSGHIPKSINLPFENVLHNGTFKTKKELIEVFNTLQIDNRPLIFSCGSGVTACIILLAYQLIRDNNTSVYDGSWTEWAQKS